MAATATAPAELGTKDFPYRFEILPLSAFFVDETYQRPPSSLVDKIAAEFDPALVGTVVSNRRNGKAKGSHALIDGGSRWRGMLKAPDAPDAIPALVYHGMSVQQEAQLFYRLQKERRGISSFFRFRAAVLAEEEEAVDIQAIADETGWELGATGSGAISAVAALEFIYRRDPDVLTRTLAILHGAWGDDKGAAAGKAAAMKGEHIRGLGQLLLQREDIDDERMVRRLSIQTPDELKRRASALREGSGQGGASPQYMARVMESIYNKRS